MIIPFRVLCFRNDKLIFWMLPKRGPWNGKQARGTKKDIKNGNKTKKARMLVTGLVSPRQQSVYFTFSIFGVFEKDWLIRDHCWACATCCLNTASNPNLTAVRLVQRVQVRFTVYQYTDARTWKPLRLRTRLTCPQRLQRLARFGQ